MSRPPDDSSATDDDTKSTTDDDTKSTTDDDTKSTTDDDTKSTTESAPGGPTGVDAVLPDAAVDSRWWYWIAAVPVFFVLSLAFGVVFVSTVVLGLFVGDGGVVLPLFVLAALFVFGGLVLTVLFPVAVYVDAEAVTAADVDWDPDPVLYGLVALAGVVATAFVVSVPLALYYLYRRHGAVGVP